MLSRYEHNRLLPPECSCSAVWRMEGFRMILTFLAISLMAGANCATYNVKDMGASGDGKTDDTQIVQEAFSNCENDGGNCKILFPSGSYLMFPVNISNVDNFKVEVQDGATLVAQTNTEDWPDDDGDPRPLLYFDHTSDVTFYGGGQINGNGDVWWQLAKENNDKAYPRPIIFDCDHCDGLELYDLTITNSPKFHVYIEHSSNVDVHNITLNSPADSPNTDGIDFSSCSNSVIRDCTIKCGDDCISMKSKHNEEVTENIEIYNIVCQNTMGLSIGSNVYSGIKNVTFHNCTMNSPSYGIRVKVKPHCEGYVQDIYYRNIVLNQPDYAIDVRMDYHSDEACSFWHDFSEWSWRAATINNLNIDDVVVNYDEDAGNPATLGRLWCSWDNWCWVYMKNITYNSVPSRFSEEKWMCYAPVGTQGDMDPECGCFGVFHHASVAIIVSVIICLVIAVCYCLCCAGCGYGGWRYYKYQKRRKAEEEGFEEMEGLASNREDSWDSSESQAVTEISVEKKSFATRLKSLFAGITKTEEEDDRQPLLSND